MTQPPNSSWDDTPGGSPAPEPSVPPPGAVPPPGGYPPPGAAAPPLGYPTAEDKTWALVAHFGGALGMFLSGGVAGWVPPLVALLVQGNKSPVARAHAVAALNFQLLWSIIGAVSWIFLCALAVIIIGFLGFLGIAAASILGIVCGIIGGLRANEGQLYKYPMSVSLIK